MDSVIELVSSQRNQEYSSAQLCAQDCDDEDQYLENTSPSARTFIDTIRNRIEDSFDSFNFVRLRRSSDLQSLEAQPQLSNLKSTPSLFSEHRQVPNKTKRERASSHEGLAGSASVIQIYRMNTNPIETRFVLDLAEAQDLNHFQQAIRTSKKSPLLLALLKRSLNQFEEFHRIQQNLTEVAYTNLICSLKCSLIKQGTTIFSFNSIGNSYFFLAKGSAYIMLRTGLGSKISNLEKPAKQQPSKLKLFRANMHEQHGNNENQIEEITKQQQQQLQEQQKKLVYLTTDKKTKFVSQAKRSQQLSLSMHSPLKRHIAVIEDPNDGNTEESPPNLKRNHSKSIDGESFDQMSIDWSASSEHNREQIRRKLPHFTIVGTHEAGSGFGEQALLKNIKRTSTVVAKEDCILLSINQEDFLKYLSEYHEKLYNQKVAFVRSFYIFDQLDQRLPNLIILFEPATFVRGESIYQAGEPTDYFYLIREGQVTVTKLIPKSADEILAQQTNTVKTSTGNSSSTNAITNSPLFKHSTNPMKEITLTTLSEGSFFGEDEIVKSSKLRETTVRATSATVSVLRISSRNLKIICRLNDIMDRLRSASQLKSEWREEYINLQQTEKAKASSFASLNPKFSQHLGESAEMNREDMEFDTPTRVTGEQSTSILNRKLQIKLTKSSSTSSNNLKQMNRSRSNASNQTSPQIASYGSTQNPKGISHTTDLSCFDPEILNQTAKDQNTIASMIPALSAAEYARMNALQRDIESFKSLNSPTHPISQSESPSKSLSARSKFPSKSFSARKKDLTRNLVTSQGLSPILDNKPFNNEIASTAAAEITYCPTPEESDNHRIRPLSGVFKCTIQSYTSRRGSSQQLRRSVDSQRILSKKQNSEKRELSVVSSFKIEQKAEKVSEGVEIQNPTDYRKIHSVLLAIDKIKNKKNDKFRKQYQDAEELFSSEAKSKKSFIIPSYDLQQHVVASLPSNTFSPQNVPERKLIRTSGPILDQSSQRPLTDIASSCLSPKKLSFYLKPTTPDRKINLRNNLTSTCSTSAEPREPEQVIIATSSSTTTPSQSQNKLREVIPIRSDKQSPEIALAKGIDSEITTMFRKLKIDTLIEKRYIDSTVASTPISRSLNPTRQSFSNSESKPSTTATKTTTTNNHSQKSPLQNRQTVPVRSFLLPEKEEQQLYSFESRKQSTKSGTESNAEGFGDYLYNQRYAQDTSPAVNQMRRRELNQSHRMTSKLKKMAAAAGTIITPTARPSLSLSTNSSLEKQIKPKQIVQLPKKYCPITPKKRS